MTALGHAIAARAVRADELMAHAMLISRLFKARRQIKTVVGLDSFNGKASSFEVRIRFSQKSVFALIDLHHFDYFLNLYQSI